tara:strand:- start:65 stop:565 length:501 start_codon:yes stop_codon:yes gene_type:complete
MVLNTKKSPSCSFNHVYGEIVYLLNRLNYTENFKQKAFINLMDYFCEHISDLCILFDYRLEKIIRKIASSASLIDINLQNEMHTYFEKLEPFFYHTSKETQEEFKESELMCSVPGYTLVPNNQYQYEMNRLDRYVSYIVIKLSKEIDLSNIETYDEFIDFFDRLNN